MTKRWFRHAGLILPPIAWAAATQLGQIMPAVDCRQGISWSAISCGLLLIISLSGIAASRTDSQGSPGTERFILDGGYLLGLAFVFALSLQGAASLLLEPCQR